MAPLTANESLRFAAVREHEVVLSVAKFLWPARHEHVVIPEEILQTGQLKHTQIKHHQTCVLSGNILIIFTEENHTHTHTRICPGTVWRIKHKSLIKMSQIQIEHIRTRDKQREGEEAEIDKINEMTERFPFVTGNLLSLSSQAHGCYGNRQVFSMISAAGQVENEKYGCRPVVGIKKSFYNE